jgi:hypothetical protein
MGKRQPIDIGLNKKSILMPFAELHGDINAGRDVDVKDKSPVKSGGKIRRNESASTSRIQEVTIVFEEFEKLCVGRAMERLSDPSRVEIP